MTSWKKAIDKIQNPEALEEELQRVQSRLHGHEGHEKIQYLRKRLKALRKREKASA